MPVFTAAAAAISTFVAGITWSTVASFAVRTLVTIGISRLIANRATNKLGAGAQDAGARIQLAPATNNKLPVVYGSAFVAPTITDAKISTDQKTMWYVGALSEKSSGTMSFGNIYYDGKLVTFGTGGNAAKVVSLTTNSDPVQVDTKIDGNLFIYLFTNGSSSGVNTGGQTAIQILQDSTIPTNQRWTSTDVMTNTAFIIVKVIYNADASTTNLGQISVQLTNTLTKPGDVLLDYMQDTVYGCAIPSSQIDTASLTALNTYSDETITYVPVGGGSTTQPRYRINGPVNTGDNCLSNLQQLVDSCDSWLQYSELTGKWKVVINKPYTGNLTDLYHVDSSVLIGGIDINPLDLNQTYNSLEVQYPDANIKDQTNYKVVDLTDNTTAWYDPTLLSPNEPDNRIVVQYPQVNNYVQAVYLGVRRLLQSREDLTIVFNLDYSGIQLEAGDTVRVTLAEYGWTNKVFRVSQVQETKDENGFLGARITAFEYNGTIYSDNAIQDYVPEANTGLTDPNIFDRPGTPVITTNTLANSGAVTSFTVTSSVPVNGTTIYMDFNYGNSNNVATHKTYTSTQLADGVPYTNGANVSIDINDLPIGNYYFSTTARNEQAGRASFSSNVYNWSANLQANSVTFTNLNNSLVKAQVLSTEVFVIPILSTNTVIPPVDITTDFNVPVYIDGTAVGSSYVFPWYQGTSSTANGYLANSTSSFNPAIASVLGITNGTDNWYIFMYSEPPGGYQNGWIAGTPLEASFVANANAQIQICPFYTTTTGGSTLIGYTHLLATYDIEQNKPIKVNLQTSTAVNSTIKGQGYLIRNITAGSRVTAIAGTLNVNRNS